MDAKPRPKHSDCKKDKLDRSFYARPAESVAEALIGKILVRRVETNNGEIIEYRARIAETEAYVGEHDLACHAAKGRTARTEIMFGPPGFAYVYLIYGVHNMLNVVVSEVGDAQAVLIRAALPMGDFAADLSGPGKLARAMHITRRDNGLDLTGDTLYFLDDGSAPPPIVRTPRIGVDYAKQWKDQLLRFMDAENHPGLNTTSRRSRGVSKG